MTITKKGTVIELDIHGMYADDAKREIERSKDEREDYLDRKEAE